MGMATGYSLFDDSKFRSLYQQLPTVQVPRGGTLYDQVVFGPRGSGRTSNMLWEAACAKDEGHRVVVVVHDQGMIHYCLSEPMKGAWWGLEKRDFVTIERAVDAFRGAGFFMLFMDHFVDEMATRSSLHARCVTELLHEYHKVRSTQAYSPFPLTVLPILP